MIEQRKYSNIQKDDLTYVSETYLGYKKKKYSYQITCESGNMYLLKLILADDEYFDNIQKGDRLTLGVVDNIIVEFSVNDSIIVSIDDCNQKYTKQFNISIIVIPILIIVSALVLLGVKLINKRTTKINETVDHNVYYNIQNSIYESNGVLHCNILEQMENDNLIYTFYKAMIDYLNDNELVLLIDDGCMNDELALVFYKNNNKLYFNQIYRENNEPFEIEKNVFWYYPIDAIVTKKEKELFNDAVDEYVSNNSELLRIEK